MFYASHNLAVRISALFANNTPLREWTTAQGELSGWDENTPHELLNFADHINERHIITQY